jgi:hypothetical protein
MDFRHGSLDFSQALRGSGPRTAQATVLFPRAVRTATAGLTGYAAEYSRRSDNHLGRLEIRLDTSVASDTVTVTGTFGVRDWSEAWDDEYDGHIGFVVVADLVSAKSPRPRGDLIITGMEMNQAAQYFRSDQFLDAENARPDNSIFLIERKTTGVRIYADWDAGAGLPPISQLTGELVVSNGSATQVLLPINPGRAIVPKRDASINQALPNDTLNFMIPAALSVGTMTVTCRVFDQASPASKSAAFTRTLLFVPVAALNIVTVGVTTTNPSGVAPTKAQISAALSMLVKMVPRTVRQTGFLTISDDNPFVGPALNSDCGGAWDSVLDQLEDLRGDSGDVFFGAMPAGFVCASSTGGCSYIGSGTAAALVDAPPSAAHEIGHALGRKHPPCVGCAKTATDRDFDYPQYGAFSSDSVGVFGFDATTNAVFDPASTLDFMSAFLNRTCKGSVISFDPRWISPYTYRGLLGATVGGPTSSAGAHRYLPAHVDTLFLRLTIGRDRKVTRERSFHYPAAVQGRSECSTAFTYEFAAQDGAVLDCGALHCACAEGSCACWPKKIRDALPIPSDARSFLVWEGDAMIYDEQIPEPPHVWITETREDAGGVRVAWDSDSQDAAYLVHWKDEHNLVYRGVAPRLDGKSLLVPRNLFTPKPQLQVRIYATSGIATGFAEQEIAVRQTRSPDLEFTLRTETPMGTAASSPVLSVVVTDPAGRQVADELITWYGAGAAAIASGPDLDLRSLPLGRHVVRAVARSFGDAIAGNSWLIDTSDEGTIVRDAPSDPPPPVRAENHVHPHAPRKDLR